MLNCLWGGGGAGIILWGGGGGSGAFCCAVYPLTLGFWVWILGAEDVFVVAGNKLLAFGVAGAAGILVRFVFDVLLAGVGGGGGFTVGRPFF